MWNVKNIYTLFSHSKMILKEIKKGNVKGIFRILKYFYNKLRPLSVTTKC